MLDQACVKLQRNLKRLQGLPESAIKDLLIVSLDIEGYIGGLPDHLTKENGEYQVGLSLLDTRNLQPRIENATLPDTQHEPLLQTHHFCLGPEKYFKKKSRKFCFGQSRHVTLEDLRDKIQMLIRKRDVILVVHGGKGDLTFLKTAQIHIRPLYVVDTQKAAQSPLQLDYRCSLKAMLTLLKCSFDPEMLHNAGNDANFTLRALLLIAAIDARNIPDSEPTCKALLSKLENTARECIPLEEFREAVKAELKRVHNSAQSRRQRRNARLKEEKAKQCKNKKNRAKECNNVI